MYNVYLSIQLQYVYQETPCFKIFKILNNLYSRERFTNAKSPVNACPTFLNKAPEDGINSVTPIKQRQRMRTSSMPAENRKVKKKAPQIYDDFMVYTSI